MRNSIIVHEKNIDVFHEKINAIIEDGYSVMISCETSKEGKAILVPNEHFEENPLAITEVGHE